MNQREEPAMHVHRSRRRVLPGSAVLLLGALLAMCLVVASATAAVSSKPKPKPKPKLSAAALAGTWSGSYSGSISGTFTLHWTLSGASLNGSITLSQPSGKYAINGVVHGSALSFGVVGAGATYTGTVSGSSMSGKWKSLTAGGGTWSAHKTS
jgi:hypothetical protein